MWHFGKDGKFEYTNNGFSLTWGYGREILRIYTKSFNGKKVMRKEHQEYPNKPWDKAIEEKLNASNSGVGFVHMEG